MAERSPYVDLAVTDAMIGAVDKCVRLPLAIERKFWHFLGAAASNTARKVEQTIPLDDHTLVLGQILFGSLDSRGRERRALLLSDL